MLQDRCNYSILLKYGIQGDSNLGRFVRHPVTTMCINKLIIVPTARDPYLNQNLARCVRVCLRHTHFDPAARGGRVGDILILMLTMKREMLCALQLN